MMNKKMAGLLLTLMLPLAGCVAPVVHEHSDSRYYGGPVYERYPGPSHGHWRWDDNLRVYVSIGFPLMYYYADRTYWRWDDRRWVRAYDYRGPWRIVETRYVPVSVRHHYQRLDKDRNWKRQYERDRREYEKRQNYRNYRDGHRDYRDDRRDWRDDRRDWRDDRRDDRHDYRSQQAPRQQPYSQLIERRQRELEQQRGQGGGSRTFTQMPPRREALPVPNQRPAQRQQEVRQFQQDMQRSQQHQSAAQQRPQREQSHVQRSDRPQRSEESRSKRSKKDEQQAE